jgi:hypothetical protein
MWIAFCRSSGRFPGFILGLGCLVLFSLALPASAAEGPFSDFRGSWSGTGTMRDGETTERIRCTANYRPQGTTDHEIDLQLRCDSDSYNFDLSGNFRADDKSYISGSWTERTRNVGGTAAGTARGDRFQLHVDSSVFSATMYITTRGGRQSVSIDARGGGKTVKASLTLRKH